MPRAEPDHSNIVIQVRLLIIITSAFPTLNSWTVTQMLHMRNTNSLSVLPLPLNGETSKCCSASIHFFWAVYSGFGVPFQFGRIFGAGSFYRVFSLLFSKLRHFFFKHAVCIPTNDADKSKGNQLWHVEIPFCFSISLLFDNFQCRSLKPKSRPERAFFNGA
jgi:hypothetical protein